MSVVSITSAVLQWPARMGDWFRLRAGMRTGNGGRTTSSRSAAARAGEFDITMLWVIAMLVAVGLLMVYSSSIASASESKFTRFSPTYFFVRQCLFVLIGSVLALFVFDTSVRTWERIAPYVFVIALVLVILVLIPGIGRVVNGARRWIPLGPFSLQPSELMKFAMVLFASRYAVTKVNVLHAAQPLKQTTRALSRSTRKGIAGQRSTSEKSG